MIYYSQLHVITKMYKQDVSPCDKFIMAYMYILFNQEMVGGKESSVISPHRSPPVSPRKPRSNLTRKSVSPRKSVSDFYD